MPAVIPPEISVSDVSSVEAMSGDDIFVAGRGKEDSAASHGVIGTPDVDLAEGGGDMEELSGVALTRYGGLQMKVDTTTASTPATEDSQELESN